MFKEIDLVACLLEYEKGAEWKIDNNDYSSLEWFSDTPKPSLKDLTDCWSAVLAKKEEKLQARAALLQKLGITEDEAKLLLS